MLSCNAWFLLQPLRIQSLCRAVRGAGLGSLVTEESGYFPSLVTSVSSAMCVRHSDLSLYLQAPWKWNHCNDTPNANFTLVWHEVQGNSAAGSLWKFSFPCYFLPRIFKKKKKKQKKNILHFQIAVHSPKRTAPLAIVFPVNKAHKTSVN